MVDSVDSDGIFADTDLHEGMQLLRVNDMDTKNMTDQQILSFLRQCDGPMTLVADDPDLFEYNLDCSLGGLLPSLSCSADDTSVRHKRTSQPENERVQQPKTRRFSFDINLFRKLRSSKTN